MGRNGQAACWRCGGGRIHHGGAEGEVAKASCLKDRSEKRRDDQDNHSLGSRGGSLEYQRKGATKLGRIIAFFIWIESGSPLFFSHLLILLYFLNETVSLRFFASQILFNLSPFELTQVDMLI